MHGLGDKPGQGCSRAVGCFAAVFCAWFAYVAWVAPPRAWRGRVPLAERDPGVKLAVVLLPATAAALFLLPGRRGEIASRALAAVAFFACLHALAGRIATDRLWEATRQGGDAVFAMALIGFPSAVYAVRGPSVLER